ncbi:hypothetical protein [Pseudomonas mangrovi]|uniref:Uncharacterized protein n=1 Tax=Pseudomonas mangrovi TaxID=2161748 RepID=A0A2T5P9J6_9PSED|nr:hypothetical protein [Pseudomonas mangrovi]PTU74409.1 hypothetical protein DBO85_09955 [Pseudomonas mangrovi]
MRWIPLLALSALPAMPLHAAPTCDVFSDPEACLGQPLSALDDRYFSPYSHPTATSIHSTDRDNPARQYVEVRAKEECIYMLYFAHTTSQSARPYAEFEAFRESVRARYPAQEWLQRERYDNLSIYDAPDRQIRLSNRHVVFYSRACPGIEIPVPRK